MAEADYVSTSQGYYLSPVTYTDWGPNACDFYFTTAGNAETAAAGIDATDPTEGEIVKVNIAVYRDMAVGGHYGKVPTF